MITEYHPSYAARARDLTCLGVPEVEIARLLGLSVGMLRAWRERYPEFAMAWDDGEYHASVKVLNALYKKAVGYDKTVWKETKDGRMMELKHVEADVRACVFILTNKHPDQWKTRPEDGGSGATLPLDAMSEIEAARRVAFALTKAVHDQQRRIQDGNASIPGETVEPGVRDG